VPKEQQNAADAPPSGFGVGTFKAKRTAEKLEEFAEKPELKSRAGQLQSLARAMNDVDHSHLWRGMNLRGVFEDAVSDAQTRTMPLHLKLLGALRMMLVFVPVALTWWGIHLAASAYNDMLAANPELVAQSFFREWLEGFGGTLWLTFDRMAMLIAGAVVALVLIWIIAEQASERYDRNAEAAHDDLEADFQSLLTDAELHLAGTTASTPDDLLSSINQVARRTDRLLEKITTISQQIREASEGMEDTSRSVREAADAATTAVKDISDAANETVRGLDSATDKLADSLDDHQSKLTESLRRYQDEMSERMQHQQNELGSMLRLVEAALQHIAEVSEQHREAIGGLLAGHHQDLEMVLPRLVQHLDEAVAAQLREHREHLIEVINPLLERQAETMNPALMELADRVIALQSQTQTIYPPQHRPRWRWW
jgi:predicted  nucleic acid-binding Zn-ribbon protein